MMLRGVVHRMRSSPWGGGRTVGIDLSLAGLGAVIEIRLAAFLDIAMSHG